MPDWVLSMWGDSLTYLNLSNNFLTGINQLPWKSLLCIDLRSNLIHGALPVLPLTTRVFLISHNKVVGEIPSSFCNLNSLRILDLSHNSLSGLIPQCLFAYGKQLSVVDMWMNGLRGTIPMKFAKRSRLKTLNLNSNQLEGTVPLSMSNCRSLKVLDLGNNKINGTFPQWLGTLTQLQILVLKSNRFHGPISSTSTTKLPFLKLQIVDLSYNEFTIPLPTRYFKGFKAMMKEDENRMELKYMGGVYYQYSVTMVTKGLLIELVTILNVFTAIDLSSNKFNGEIPNFENLNSLRVLNLFHNIFVGHIPSVLGKLSVLESLDLSSNQLVREIPEQLTSLTFLAVLNLSQNHLTGRIPQGKQFNTFQNDSHSGSIALCGFPLLKGCGEDDTPQLTLPQVFHEEDEGFASGFTWKVVLLGCGCGTIFGLVAGFLMFLTKKPKWFVGIVEGGHKKMRQKKN